MSDPDPHLTISDIRPFFCVRGIRRAFEDAGLPFDDFLRNGAPASKLRGHGFDAAIDRVVLGGKVEGQ